MQSRQHQAYKENLSKDDVEHLIHPNADLLRLAESGPTIFVRGHGATVTDIDGRHYINAVSWLWCSNIGHGRSEMAEVAKRQIEDIEYVSLFWGNSNVPAIELATRLAQLAPPGLGQVMFTSGGSDSVETAIRLARLYHFVQGRPQKQKVLARERAYHGVFGLSGSATGFDAFHEGFGLLDPGIVRVAAPYCYRCPNAGTSQCCAVDQTAKVIETEGADTIAAIIVEPVMGAGGSIVPSADYLPRLARLCRDNQILLISDEVVTGFGRTGRWFGVDHWGVVPDMMACAKGLTSGYAPLGAVIMKDEIGRAFRETKDHQLHHGVTYSGHPVCCALALKNLEIIEQEKLIERARDLGKRLLEQFEEFREFEIVGDVRGLGLIFGIELVADRFTKEPLPIADQEITDRFLELGLIARLSRGLIILSPPFVLTDEEAEEIVRILRRVLAEVQQRVKGQAFERGSETGSKSSKSTRN
ncbi:MAG: aspartate aminotransferase family protein [Dehalococcoidia bacterium]